MLVDADVELNPNWKPVLCRVITDVGLYGDGEAAVAFAFGAHAAFGALQDMAPLVIGRNPLDIEGAWDRLHYDSFWAQNGGLAHMAAISAIDIALWDIAGKYHGVPVHELLGGKLHDNLPSYASQLQNGWSSGREAARTPEDYAANAAKALDQGYETVKVDFLAHRPGKGHYTFQETGLPSNETLHVFEERLAAVRSAVGSDVEIAVEGHAVFDVEGAVAVGRIAQRYDALFFEEPTSSYPELVRQVRRKLDVPIALGERVYTRWGFEPFFEKGLVDVIQPDVGTVGGISEVKRICANSLGRNVSVQLHDCGTPLLNAATLSVEATLPNLLFHEHHVNNLHEYNRRLGTVDFQPERGRIAVPDMPGLGCTISQYALEHSKHVVVS